MTGAVLKQLARELDIPTWVSEDELQQLIDGKLGDMGHNPWNTQALLQEAETGVSVSLQDVNRVLTMELIYIELLGPHDTHEDPVESTERSQHFQGSPSRSRRAAGHTELEVAKLKELVN